MIRNIGIVGSSHIFEFILNNVLPPDNYYLSFKKEIFHFEKYSNTPQKVTNTGLKYSSTSVITFHTLLEPHEVQVNQDEKKNHTLEEEGASEFLNAKIWSNTRTNYFFATTAEPIIERHISEVEDYAYLRTCDNKFLLSRSGMLKCDTNIPKFYKFMRLKR